ASRPEGRRPGVSGPGRGTFLPGLAIGGDALCARPLADEALVRLPVRAGSGEQVLAVDRLGRNRDHREARPGGAIGLAELGSGHVRREARQALEGGDVARQQLAYAGGVALADGSAEER